MSDTDFTLPADAEEQSTQRFRVRVKGYDQDDRVVIRINREEGTGLPIYDTMRLTFEEAEALKIALMNETD